jgi:DNA-binding transcriptional MocR family regulator
LLQYKILNVQLQYRFAGRSATEIAASIESAVRDARLAPGSRLPTVRELARTLRVSPTTIAAAYQRLRLRGLVAGQGRRGTRVTHRPPLLARSPVAAAKGLRNLADGNPDPSLLPRHAAAVAPRRPRLYGEQNELPELLALARRQLAADGVRGEPAVVAGGLDGIERVLIAHLAPGDRIAVEDPGFTGVFDLVSALGLVAEPVRVDDRGLLPRDLARALDDGVAAVVVTPRAQNPTGAAIDDERARELGAVRERHRDVLVVEDDHAGPVSGAPVVTLSGRTKRWAVVRSVSKSLGPDLRLAVVAADEATVARVQGRQRLGMGWVSHVLQNIVAALWADRRLTGRLAAASKAYTERRRALLERLRSRGIAAHGRSGLNVWIPVAEEAAAVAALAERGWAVRAGEPYRVKTPPAIRVTISTLEPREAEKFADDVAAVVRPVRPTSPIR